MAKYGWGRSKLSDVKAVPLGKLKLLELIPSLFGEEGIKALADSIENGKLPSLEEVWVHENDPQEHPRLEAACEARDIELVPNYVNW